MKTLCVENTWLNRNYVDYGWGNGYVLIPEGHPAHGKDYNDVDVDVHGGLTFAQVVDDKLMGFYHQLTAEDKGAWMVGFDTAHLNDNPYNCSQVFVEAETELLKKQLEEMI